MKQIRVPGINSLLGRYTYVSMFLCLLLLSVATIGQFYVNKQSMAHEQEMEIHSIAASDVQTLSYQLHNLESAIWQFILLPKKERLQTLNHKFKIYNEEISRVISAPWTNEMPELKPVLEKVGNKSNHINTVLKKLINTRLDAEKTFPVTTHMFELVADNDEIFNAVSLALDEMEYRGDISTNPKAYEHFSKLRYFWARLIADVRLMSSIRLGIFAGDTETALSVRKKNVLLYIQAVKNHLNQLNKMEHQNKIPDFQSTESLEQLRISIEKGIQHTEQAMRILESELWRTDLPLFQTEIVPLVTSTSVIFKQANTSIDIYFKNSMSAMRDTADNLSKTLWLISFAGLMIIAGGYLIVDRGLLRPVTSFTRAFREEARGGKPVLTLNTSLEEANNLAQAFKDMREQIYIRQQSLENILDNAAEAIITVNDSGVIESFNHAAEQLFGYQEKEVLNKSAFMLTSNPEQFQKDNYIAELLKTGESGLIGNVWEMNIQRKDGSFVRVALKISSTLVGDKRLYTGLVEDVSERFKMVTKLQQMAEQDSLTGLPNRALFQDRLGHAIEQAKRSKTLVALMFLDLDKFKDINDSLGHHAGDEVLKTVAKRLRDAIRQGDTVARLGGDEFTIVLEGLSQKHEVANVAEKILEVFSSPIILRKQEYYIDTSIGITLFPQDSEDQDVLIRNADTAMYHAKQHGGSSYEFYSQEMSSEIKKRLKTQTELHQAVKNKEFVVYYQPIVHLKSGKFIGVEALLRWNHPEKGLILPGEFIEILEETGLIIQVTEWILSQVGDCYQQLKAAGLSNTSISVNFTPQCFNMINMANCIENFLSLNRLPPQNLIIEVTENILISAGDHAVTAIQQLKEFGIRIALDDFGTGYSSLSHLRSFPIDIIKIDREFVQDVTMNPDDAALATAIISMAHHLGLKVTAEGIETTGQLEFMRAEQCDAIQGYLISRPVPIDKIIAAFGGREIDDINQVVHINKRRPT